jgi:hypothetical protein
MAKPKQTTRLQKRDWVILVLFLSIIGTNWVWYQSSKAQDLSHRSHAESWLYQQVQINKLKACIDDGTSPCDINPQIQ